MTNNYSRVERWWIPGVVAVSVFSIGRVGIDEIEKGKLWG